MLRGISKMRAISIAMLVNTAAALGYVVYLYIHFGKEDFGTEYTGYVYQLALVLGFEFYKLISGFVSFRSDGCRENSTAIRNNGIIMTGLSAAWVYLAIRNHTSGLGIVGGQFSETFMILTALVDLLCSQLLILSTIGEKEETEFDNTADRKNYICPKFVFK